MVRLQRLIDLKGGIWMVKDGETHKTWVEVVNGEQIERHHLGDFAVFLYPATFKSLPPQNLSILPSLEESSNYLTSSINIIYEDPSSWLDDKGFTLIQ